MFADKRNGRIPTQFFHNRSQEKPRAKPIRQKKQTREELEKTRTYPTEVN
jgi:hypothetical protein